MFLTYYTAGDTRNRGRHCWRSPRPTARPASSRRPGTARPPAGAARIRRHRRPGGRRRLLAEHRMPIDLLHEALPGVAVRAVPSQRCARRCRRATEADLRGPSGSRMPGPPAESVGLEPFTLTMPPRRAEGGAMNVGRGLLGRRAVRDHRDPGGRHLVALPLRQVRLDHPVVAALRDAAAADRQPAVPFRHPGGDLRARHRPGHPGVLDRRDRAEPARLPRPGGAPRHIAGIATLAGVALLVYRRRTKGPVFMATTGTTS